MDSIAGSGLVRIAHRFRAHWSGADIDGEVVGFYVAVTETTIDATTGRPFRLPPPKPSQYRFTTSFDSLFSFTVTEGRGTDREHALYVYAIDNQGKVDATPAVTHFVARDQNLPTVLFPKDYNPNDGVDSTGAVATGRFFELNDLGQLEEARFYRELTDSFDVPPHAPWDTIPSGAAVAFKWRGVDRDFGSYITGYLYKLTETEFVRVDSNVTSIEYGTGAGPNGGTIPIGLNAFRIRAIDEAGGTTQPDALRQFFVNFSPDTWFAGPDPVALAPNLESDSIGTYFPLAPLGGWPLDFPGNPIGVDTLNRLPAEREPMDGLTPERPKTFVEGRILLDRTLRYYIKQEDDTVAFGSRLVFRVGGFDKDSPYNVRGGSPDSASRVFRSGPQNGSPAAIQARVVTQFPTGGSDSPPFSTAFPNVDPLDPFNNPTILYQIQSYDETGRGHIQARAVDGDRTADLRIGDPVRDLPNLPRELRSKILTFYANFNPGLQVFSPRADSVIDPVGNRFQVVVRCMDPDPDPTLPTLPGPYRTMYFSVRARVYDPNDPPAPDLGWQDPVRGNYAPDVNAFPYTTPITLDIDVPTVLPTGRTILEIEVADNAERTNARIIRVQIPFYWRVGP